MLNCARDGVERGKLSIPGVYFSEISHNWPCGNLEPMRLGVDDINTSCNTGSKIAKHFVSFLAI